MHDIPGLIHAYGIALVFAAVLVEGVGLPVPSFAVVVLAASVLEHSRLPLLLLAALSASMLTDVAWYWAGNRLGYRLLRALCRLSLSTDSCVSRTEGLFLRWGLSSLLVSRFLPGYSVIAQPLAGALRQPLLPFLLYDFSGAVIWCVAGMALGVLFTSAIDDVLNALSRFGTYGTSALCIALVAYIAYRWYRRMALIKRLRMDRITAPELHKLIADDVGLIVLDIRSPGARAREGMIPGSIHVAPDAIGSLEARLFAAPEIVIYCACPNEASAAFIAQQLLARGARRVRPLLGGIDAWTGAGFEVETLLMPGDLTIQTGQIV